jgi:hypothetical protein
VEDFPRVQLLLLLVGCAVLVRLPTNLLSDLRRQRRLHALVSVVWLSLLAGALVPSVLYARDRLLLAFHPWSAPQGAAVAESSRFELLAQQDAPPPPSEAPAGAPDEEERAEQDRGSDKRRAVQQKVSKLYAEGQGIASVLGGGGSLSGSLAYKGTGVSDVKAQIIRPVAFESSRLPLTQLHFELGSLLPGGKSSTTVLLAGPWLRGTWLFAECAGLGALWVFVMARARRLWSRKEVV